MIFGLYHIRIKYTINGFGSNACMGIVLFVFGSIYFKLYVRGTPPSPLPYIVQPSPP